LDTSSVWTVTDDHSLHDRLGVLRGDATDGLDKIIYLLLRIDPSDIHENDRVTGET
jgi:hypothetical protein